MFTSCRVRGHFMLPLKRSSCFLAVVGMMFGVTSLFAQNVENLLDPSLDRPLPQYERTNDVGFAELAPVSKSPALGGDFIPLKTPEALPSGSRSGTRLAPNPLKELLKQEEGQRSLSDVPVTNRAPTQLQVPKRTEKAPAADYEKPKLSPRPQKTTVEPSQRLKKPTKTKQGDAKSKVAKKVNESGRKPVMNFDIYRDVSQYPLDPRKPNNPCSQGSNCGCGCQAPGFRGRPYQPREPGGYSCGERCPNKRPQFSVYWPRPFSAKLDERHPDRANERYSGRQQKKLVDVFDRLVNFRLVDYQRTDNGYCGPESDPYGCLGESKQLQGSAHFGGVQFIPASMAVPVPGYPLR